MPLPWTSSGPSLGFGSGAPWLPQPPEWAALSAEAEDGVPGSMLELYRRALAARRADSSLGDGTLQWLDAPPAGVLAFRRSGATGEASTVCVVNLGSEPLDLATYGTVQLASDPLTPAGALPTDTTAWLTAQ